MFYLIAREHDVIIIADCKRKGQIWRANGDRHARFLTNWEAERQRLTDRQTCRQAAKHGNRQTSRQIDKQVVLNLQNSKKKL